MSNKYFPDWEKANLVLDTFIDEHFGVYMSRPTEDTAYITFLPEDKLAEVIPPEEAPRLNELARGFSTFMNFLLGQRGVLEDVDDQLPDEDKEKEIKTRFENFMNDYKEEKKDTIKEVLKHFLGLPVMLQEHY